VPLGSNLRNNSATYFNDWHCVLLRINSDFFPSTILRAFVMKVQCSFCGLGNAFLGSTGIRKETSVLCSKWDRRQSCRLILPRKRGAHFEQIGAWCEEMQPKDAYKIRYKAPSKRKTCASATWISLKPSYIRPLLSSGVISHTECVRIKLDVLQIDFGSINKSENIRYNSYS